MPVTEAYESFNSGQDLYFKDADGNEIKVLNITKEEYAGKIYDVDVGNDIVLVRRENGTAIWSGNSDTLVYDHSASGNNATCAGTACPTFTKSGRLGGAFAFDENNDRYQTTDFGDAFDNLTLSFWFKDSDDAGSYYEYMFSWGDVGTSNSINLYLGEASGPVAGNLRMNINDGSETGQYVDVTSTGLIDGNWHMYTMVKNSSGTDIFIDGVFNVSGGAIGNGPINPGTDLYVGGREDGNTYRYYGGYIDELAIWNKSLSASEIDDLYKARYGKYYWYVNATDYAANGTSSLHWFELAETTATYCYNCSDCSEKIASASAGDTIYLADNITNSNTDYCINISTDNIIFDGQGYEIDANKSAEPDYGIYLYRDSITETNVTIRNVKVTDWDTAGIYLRDAQNNLIDEATVSNCSDYSIHFLQNADYSNITSSNITLNQGAGVRIFNTRGWKIYDTEISNNSADITAATQYDTDCNDIETINVTGTGGGAIVAYDSAVTISGWNNNASQLLFCNADGSVVANSTFTGYGINRALYLDSTENTRIENITISDYDYGIYSFETMRETNISNLNISSCNYGIRSSYSSSGSARIRNSYFSNVAGSAIFLLYNSNFIVDNCTIKDSATGIRLGANAVEHSFINNRISNMSSYGIRFPDSQFHNNTFYNNYLNNSVNAYFEGPKYNNSWNTSRQAGTSIIGGSFLGGNFWTTPNADGWSDNCTDSTGDGICEQQYNITTNNTDYYPLTYNTICHYQCYNCSNCSETIANANPGEIVCLADNIIDSNDSYCINISTDNIIFDGQGYTIGANESAGPEYGIYMYRDSAIEANVTIQDVLVKNWDTNIYMRNSEKVNISNVVLRDSTSSNGIYLYTSDYCTMDNITAVNNSYGININLNTDYTTINNSNISENVNYGIYILSIDPLTIQDTVIEENRLHDIKIQNNVPDCAGSVYTNVTGSGGYPIEFYNTQSLIENRTFSELILCDADYSVVRNVTISASSTYQNNMLHGRNLKNVLFQNIYSTHNQYGIELRTCSDNTLANLTLRDNAVGLLLSSYNNTVVNSSIINSTDSGISTRNMGANWDGSIQVPCLIYNNYFNNTVNVDFSGTIYNNSWNTTKQAGTNIIGGNYLGGNFWTRPNGDGFSDNCTDTNGDGICEEDYNLTDHNFDYEPLTYNNDTGPTIKQANITSSTSYQNASFNCSVLPLDNQSQNINISFTWYVNGAVNSTWNTTVECTNNTWCYTDSYPSGFLKHYNITCSARAFDGSLYSRWKNSSTVEIQNSPPTNSSLLRPENNNNTILNRTPTFNWTQSSDPDSDSLTYQINITRISCSSPLACSVSNIIHNTSDLNYTPSQALDLDSTYNWTIRVWDGEDWSPTTEPWNFSILSTSIITLTDSISFGTLQPNDINDTTDNDPQPFLIENDGNVHVNISIYATDALWESQTLNTTYFQYKADNSSETNSFNWDYSQTSWTPINGTTADAKQLAVSYLNYTANDSCEIEIYIQVPGSEPTGTKSSSITVEAEYSG